MTNQEVAVFAAPAIVAGLCWIYVWWRLRH